MKVVRDPSPGEFLRHAGALLYAREAENGLPLGLVEALQTYLKPDITPLLLRVEEDGETTAVCVQTRRENVVVTHLGEAQAAVLAGYFREHGIELPGVIGPVAGESSAAALCRNYSTAPVQVRMRNRILQLTRVISPRPAPGRLRKAGPADFATVRRFVHEFFVGWLPHEVPSDEKLTALVDSGIARGTAYLWEDDGVAVSIAHSTRPTRHGVAIGAVYTPPEERGKGYASNLVAALSQRLLDEGKEFCVLFTDTENPTSNKIYESVGYRVIGASEFLSYG